MVINLARRRTGKGNQKKKNGEKGGGRKEKFRKEYCRMKEATKEATDGHPSGGGENAKQSDPA